MKNEKISYEMLSSMYNRLVASHRDLQEQIREKEKCWGAKEKAHQHTIDLAKSLCEMIVAKVPTDDFLGKSFSWSSVPIDDLIARSKKTFIEYNAERTEELKNVEAKLHEAQTLAENLQTQLEYAINSGEVPQGRSTGQPKNDVSEGTLREQEPGGEKIDVLPDKTKSSIRDAAERGTVEVCYIEEDQDITDDDLMQQAEMAEIGAKLQIATDAPPVALTQKSKKNIDGTRKATSGNSSAVMTDVSKLEEAMTDRRWAIIKVMGQTGYYLPKDIYYEIFNTEMTDTQNSDNSKFRIDLHNLLLSGVIKKETIQNPIIKKLCVYSLTSSGAVIYKRKFGKDAKESLLKQIAKDHDNLEHGLGITILAETFVASEDYTDVSTDRKKNTVKLKSGDVFIPDIVAKHKSGEMLYFEYERGTHNTTNIRIKLNKMAVATRKMNIVVPDSKVAENMNFKVLEWVKTRGGFGFLKNHIVGITTASKLKTAIENGGDCTSPDVWIYRYDLGKTAEENGLRTVET